MELAFPMVANKRGGLKTGVCCGFEGRIKEVLWRNGRDWRRGNFESINETIDGQLLNSSEVIIFQHSQTEIVRVNSCLGDGRTFLCLLLVCSCEQLDAMAGIVFS